MPLGARSVVRGARFRTAPRSRSGVRGPGLAAPTPPGALTGDTSRRQGVRRVNSRDWRQAVFGAVKLHASATAMAVCFSRPTDSEGSVRELPGPDLHASGRSRRGVRHHGHLVTGIHPRPPRDSQGWGGRLGGLVVSPAGPWRRLPHAPPGRPLSCRRDRSSPGRRPHGYGGGARRSPGSWRSAQRPRGPARRAPGRPWRRRRAPRMEPRWLIGPRMSVQSDCRSFGA